MNNTNNALETLVQRDKQIKKANDKLKAELETTTNALSNHTNDTNIHTSKEELIQLIVDHLESFDLGITKEVVSVLPTENISDNTLYFVPNEKGYHNEYLYINDKWELVGSTETNFTDYYTKLETNTLLEGKANSVHSHVVNDITDFPTIPTKLSQLENDIGFEPGSGGVITSISWSDITNKPNFATVATSGSYNDLSNKPTIPNVYNKTLTIQKNGTNVATFTSNSNTDVTADITVPTKVSELSNDSGFITGISWDKVTNKPTLAIVATSGSYTDLSNTPTIPTKVSQLENDTGFINALTDVVYTKSNQTINGNKTFTNQLYLGAGGGSYGLISAKDNNSILRLFGGTSPSTGANLDLYGENLSSGGFTLRARTSDKIVGLDGKTDGTLKWNGKNVALDENLVHRSGDETIAGNKTFSNRVSFPSGYYMTTEASDNSLRIIRSGSNHGNNHKIIIQGDTGKIFAPNGFIGNLQGNADTATSANSATYSTTPATTDNSTKIATTAWVRTYVDSVAGSNTVGSSVSAYWSNSSNVTATGQTSATNGYYPSGYSEYITKTPTVGTIYSGAQLYTSLDAYANATGKVQSSGQYATHITSVTAQATFSNPISSTGKYLCTTANTVRFRAYAPGGNSVGTASVIENSSTKSIFIRVE